MQKQARFKLSLVLGIIGLTIMSTCLYFLLNQENQYKELSFSPRKVKYQKAYDLVEQARFLLIEGIKKSNFQAITDNVPADMKKNYIEGTKTLYESYITDQATKDFYLHFL